MEYLSNSLSAWAVLRNIPTLLHQDTTDPLVVVVNEEEEGQEDDGISLMVSIPLCSVWCYA